MQLKLKICILPNNYGIDALKTIVYLRNKTLHSTTNQIPFTLWYGQKPNINHFRKFGSIAGMHAHSTTEKEVTTKS